MIPSKGKRDKAQKSKSFLYVPPVGRCVTALALDAESAEMHIVLSVATDTGSADICPSCNRGFMTPITFNFQVCSIKGVTGFTMVKIPGFPSPGVMANFASGTETAFMNILLVVAGNTS